MQSHYRIAAFLTAGLFLGGAVATTHAAQILLNGESPDTGTTATNKLGTSGVTFHNNAAVDSNAADAAFGSGSFSFSNGQSTTAANGIELLDTKGETLSQFTWAADVKLDKVNGIQRIFSGQAVVSGVLKNMGLQVNNAYQNYSTDIGFFIGSYIIPWGNHGVLGYNKPAAETGVYHNVALTFDGTNVTLYWDGASIATSTMTGPTLYTNLFVGSDSANNAIYPYHGNMDDIVVLDRALSAADVAYMAQHGATALLVPEPASLGMLLSVGLIGLYRRRRA